MSDAADRPRRHRLTTTAARLVLALCAVLVPTLAPGQEPSTIRITGDRLSGVVLPIEPLASDITLEALRGWAWDVDDTRRLLLEGDVRVRIGGQQFVADSATVWLNRLPSAEGLINQVAVYFDDAGVPNRRSGVGVAGSDLLVTGSARGQVNLVVSLMERRRPRLNATVERGEARLANHLRQLLAVTPELQQRPQAELPAQPESFRPEPGGVFPPREPELPSDIQLPQIEQHTPPLLMPRSTVRFSAGQIDIHPGAEENVIILQDRLVADLLTAEPGQNWSQVTLSAQRGVIFTRPGPIEEMARQQLGIEDVRGLYLEGDVMITVEDGDYVARAPQVYYDFQTGQAIMLDAVLRTYARQTNIPVYARAREMRQIASNQWEARRVHVSTSEFAVPHLAIGAQRMVVTRRPARADPEKRETHIVSEGNSLQVGGTSTLGWPRFQGTIKDLPLRSATIGTRSEDGLRVETRWNLASLLGRDTPPGTEVDLRLDAFTKRGAAIGLDLRYDDEASGWLDLYGMYDEGTDRTSSGEDVDQEDARRGVALWEHDVKLGRSWLFQAQGAYISDPSFITTWREDDFAERREYETSAYLKNQVDNTALTLLTRYELNDFISNDYLLASRGYQVDRMPELTYRRYGDAWGKGISYSSETRVDRMRLVLDESTPAESGVPGRAFGIPPNVPISDALRAQGLSSQWLSRFDTRHELTFPTSWGNVRFLPFLVGRLTVYDDDEILEEYSEDAESTRVYGAAGLRVSTELQHIDNTVSNRLLDLHRLRHVIEPSLTLWYGYTDVSEEDLPEYDYQVESIGEGATMRVGVRNTWQTQRGGLGRWRSVDYLTVNTDLVLTSNDTNQTSPVARFFDYRPEYSTFGDHVSASAVWLLTDAFSIVTEQTIDIDESALARGSIGADLRHTPDLTTYVEFRYLDASDNRLLGLGWDYRLSSTYRLNLTPQWDFEADEFRAFSVRVTRSFGDFDLTVQVRRDEIRDDTTVGASVDVIEF